MSERAHARVGLILILLTAAITYTILVTAYNAFTEPDDPRTCVTDSGHERRPCPTEQQEKN